MFCSAEGHSIKNHTSKTAQAVYRVEADRRWFLSATPMQNEISDLFSVFRFLRAAPIDDFQTFKAVIIDGGAAGVVRLRVRLHVVSDERVPFLSVF
jgi:SNF2 family DNA or RNA helicase